MEIKHGIRKVRDLRLDSTPNIPNYVFYLFENSFKRKPVNNG